MTEKRITTMGKLVRHKTDEPRVLDERGKKFWANIERRELETELLGLIDNGSEEIREKVRQMSPQDMAALIQLQNDLNKFQAAQRLKTAQVSELPVANESVRQLALELREGRLNGTLTLPDALAAAQRAFSNIPCEERDVILNNIFTTLQPIVNELGVDSKLDEILTVGSAVVTYRPKILNMTAAGKQKVRDAITAILRANPSADLATIQDSLGITVLNVQRSAQPSTAKKGFIG